MQGMQAWLVVILMVALASGACASQRTRAEQPRSSDTAAAAIPLSDVSSLAGKWRGWYTGASGSSQPLEVDVNPDGTYRSQMGTRTGMGTFRIENGKIITSGQLLGPEGPFDRTAVATLTEKNGKRVIKGQGETSARPYTFEITKE